MSDKYIDEQVIKTREELKKHTAREMALYDSKLDVKDQKT